MTLKDYVSTYEFYVVKEGLEIRVGLKLDVVIIVTIKIIALNKARIATTYAIHASAVHPVSVLKN